MQVPVPCRRCARPAHQPDAAPSTTSRLRPPEPHVQRKASTSSRTLRAGETTGRCHLMIGAECPRRRLGLENAAVTLSCGQPAMEENGLESPPSRPHLRGRRRMVIEWKTRARLRAAVQANRKRAPKAQGTNSIKPSLDPALLHTKQSIFRGRGQSLQSPSPNPSSLIWVTRLAKLSQHRRAQKKPPGRYRKLGTCWILRP